MTEPQLDNDRHSNLFDCFKSTLKIEEETKGGNQKVTLIPAVFQIVMTNN